MLNGLREPLLRAVSCRLETYDYARRFTGRKVVLIGPNSLLDTTDRERIADADVCVVMNKGMRMPAFQLAKELGVPVAYFHCLDPSPVWGGGPLSTYVLRRTGFHELFYPLDDQRLEANVERFHRTNSGLLPLRRVAKDVYAAMERTLEGFRPTSGFAIAASLAPVPGCRLYITGLTFYRKAYMPTYSAHLSDLASIKAQMEAHGVHHPDREYIAFTRLVEQHGVEVDAQLRTILSTPYAPLFYTAPGDERLVEEFEA